MRDRLTQELIAISKERLAVSKALLERLEKTYGHHSAKAKCSMTEGVLEIDYTGPISHTSIDYLDGELLDRRMQSSSTIERMDKAMTMWTGPVQLDRRIYPAAMPPSAVIVRPDQYARSLAFCQLLAKCGVHRMAFLQPSAAHDWLEQYQV